MLIFTKTIQMGDKTANVIAKIVLLILAYFVFAGCAWHLNPALWGGFWRFLCIVVFLAIVFHDFDD